MSIPGSPTIPPLRDSLANVSDGNMPVNNDGTLANSPLSVSTNAQGESQVNVETTIDTIVFNNFSAITEATGARQTISYNFTPATDFDVQAVGLRFQARSGETQVTGVKIQIAIPNPSQGSPDIAVAHSPSQTVYDDADAPGLSVDASDSPAVLFFMLESQLSMEQGESYIITVSWLDGILFHTNNVPYTSLRHRENIQIAHEMSVSDLDFEIQDLSETIFSRINGINPLGQTLAHIPITKPLRSPRTIQFDDDTQLLMRGNVLGYRGRGYDTFVPFINRSAPSLNSVTQTIVAAGGSSVTQQGTDSSVTQQDQSVTFDITALRQCLLQDIRVRQVAGLPEVTGCNVLIQQSIDGAYQTVFDLLKDTGRTATLFAGDQNSNLLGLTDQARIPLIADSGMTTVDLRVTITIPNGVTGVSLLNTAQSAFAVMTLNSISVRDLIESKAPLTLTNNDATAIVEVAPTAQNRNRYTYRAILFAGDGSHIFRLPDSVFQDGDYIDFKVIGTGTATLRLAENRTFPDNGQRNYVLRQHESARFIYRPNNWYLTSEVKEQAQAANNVTGSLTDNTVPVAIGANTLGDSPITLTARDPDTLYRRPVIVTPPTGTEDNIVSDPGLGFATFQVIAPLSNDSPYLIGQYTPTSDQIVTAVGFYLHTQSGGNVEGLRFRVLNAQDEVLAYFPDRATFDASGGVSRATNNSVQSATYHELQQPITLSAGEVYSVQLWFNSPISTTGDRVFVRGRRDNVDDPTASIAFALRTITQGTVSNLITEQEINDRFGGGGVTTSGSFDGGVIYLPLPTAPNFRILFRGVSFAGGRHSTQALHMIPVGSGTATAATVDFSVAVSTDRQTTSDLRYRMNNQRTIQFVQNITNQANGQVIGSMDVFNANSATGIFVINGELSYVDTNLQAATARFSVRSEVPVNISHLRMFPVSGNIAGNYLITPYG